MTDDRRSRYDVVIVGGGSAGCVLASRLSEDPSQQILLVEAGSDTGVDATELVERTAGSDLTSYRFGRGLGGSSSINGMIATAGPAADYDRWERELGCDGWGWSAVASSFAAIAVPTAPAPTREWGPVDRAVVDAAQQLGHPRAVGPDVPGVGPADLTRADGERITVADVYLAPARSRPNLTIQIGTSIDRVLIDSRRAVGVVTSDGDVIEAASVVLAAGAIHSPLLLLRSGVDLPGVGRGVKDHPSFAIGLRMREPAATTTLQSATLLRWSSSIGDNDLQLLPVNAIDGSGYGAVIVAAMSVASEGTIELVDGQPRVRFHMLDDESDRRRMREAARHAAALVATGPFVEITDRAFIDDVGTSIDELAGDDAALDRWIAAHTGDYYHASCSCRMGPSAESGAVVDARGRVHGYDGLRVCDASVFPDLPRANTYLPTLMVAEHISRFMRSAS